jgi:hypothetical protein
LSALKRGGILKIKGLVQGEEKNLKFWIKQCNQVVKKWQPNILPTNQNTPPKNK